MDPRPNKNIHADHSAASMTPDSGQKQSKNSKKALVASTQAVESASTDRWLKQKPDQEPWNTQARMNEGRPEKMSMK
jgi:hypothetical protein